MKWGKNVDLSSQPQVWVCRTTDLRFPRQKWSLKIVASGFLSAWHLFMIFFFLKNSQINDGPLKEAGHTHPARNGAANHPA